MVIVRDVFRHDPLTGHLFVLSRSGATACASCTGIGAAPPLVGAETLDQPARHAAVRRA
jgi:hypothetical protein